MPRCVLGNTHINLVANFDIPLELLGCVDGSGGCSQRHGLNILPANRLLALCFLDATIAYNQSLVAASLYVDYVFLDTDERRRFAQNPYEYLITQLQFTGDESVGSSSNKIKLNFNHPVD